MATVLYYGVDNRIQQMLEPFFKNRKEEAQEIHSITVISEEKKFDEAITGMTFDILMIEQTHLSTTPPQWLESFMAKRPAWKNPILLIGDETDPTKILKFVEAGFRDYLVLPPDKPLVIEKFGLHATGKRSKDIRQVYSLNLSQQADLAKPGVVEELSEFDCKIRSSTGAQEGDFMILYSNAFGADMSAKGSVLGRCYKNEEHPSFKGQYLSHLYFIGVTTEVLSNIRNALRKTYVASKNR